MISLLFITVYELEAPGRDGVVKPFHKPWACTATMFIGMAFCLPIAYGIKLWEKRQSKAADSSSSTPLLKGDEDGKLGTKVSII